MKKVILLVGILVSLAAAHVVMGQSGVILYEQKINMHRNIPAEREAMKAMIPEFRTTKQQLFFNSAESLYKTVIEDEEEQFSNGGMRMSFRMPNTEMYMHHSGKIISKQEFMGKNYLIEDSVQMSPWKFGDQVKTIAGYECRMAYFTRTDTIPTMVISGPGASETKREPQVRTTEITAWYTDKIRPFLGPERYNTLPGAVLAIDMNNGERVIVAKTVELRELKKNELKEPTSGTKTTQAEFRKLMEEQMKQMGGRGMTIRN
ncbi:MAG: GLPGLI family protein [Cyclobacteriaceae bacterium]|nr:GLPGLI family protein [Cyclobacteriaceae bacterium]